MKVNFILTLLFCLCLRILPAQNNLIFENSPQIFSYDTSGSIYGELYNAPFKPTVRTHTTSKLISHPDGKIYGVCDDYSQGGTAYIFSFDTLTERHAIRAEIDGPYGSLHPNGFLTLGPGNKLFGTTNNGGSYTGTGTIFSFDPATNTYSTLATTGHSDSELYSVMNIEKLSPTELVICYKYGGPNNSGGYQIFDLTSNSVTSTVYYEGNNSTGGRLTGSLSLLSNGWLYGYNTIGTATTVFVTRSNPITGFSERLNSNVSQTGHYANAKLLEASNGTIYGLTEGGSIQTFTVNNKNLTLTHPAVVTNNLNPNLDKPVEHNGKIFFTYATATFGSFRYYNMALNTTTQLHYSNAAYVPREQSITKMNGVIYSCTDGGGTFGYGHITKYDTVTNLLVQIYNFDGTNGGKGEIIRPLSSGLLCGVTAMGGTANAGVVFTYDPALNQYNVIASLDSLTDGINPGKELYQVSANEIVFFTIRGGLYNGGALVKVNLTTGVKTVLYSYGVNPNTITNPVGEMISYSGNMYGVGTTGGTYAHGGIFKFDPATNLVEDVATQYRYKFTGLFSSQVALYNNKFYGIVDTILGSPHLNIYEVDPATGNFIIKKRLFDPLISASQMVVPFLPFYPVNNRLLTLANYNNGIVVASYDPVTNAVTVECTLPAGYNWAYFHTQMNSLSPSEVCFTYTDGTGATAGKILVYDINTHLITATTSLSNNGNTTAGYYLLNSIPVKYGNRYWGITGLGMVPTNFYPYSGSSLYSYNRATNSVTNEITDGYDENFRHGFTGRVFEHNNSLYSLITVDSGGVTFMLHEIHPNHTSSDYLIQTNDSTYQMLRSFQYQDSLVFFTLRNEISNNKEWIYKLNLNTHQTILLYTSNPLAYPVNSLVCINGNLYGTGTNYSSGHEELFKYTISTSAFSVLDANLNDELISIFTDNVNLYTVQKSTSTNYNYINKYDVGNNDAQSMFFDFAPGIATHNCVNVEWCGIQGNQIIGVSTVFGSFEGVFKINLSTAVISIDPFYTNLGLYQDIGNVFLLSGNTIYSQDYSDNTILYVHNFQNHTIRTQIVSQTFHSILPLFDSITVHIDSIMQSTCLSSKQVLVAHGEVANPTFQWYLNNTKLTAETNDTLTVQMLTPADTGMYYCMIGTSYGSVQSNSVHIGFDYCNQVYPGDANSDSLVNAIDILQIGLGFGATGLARSSVSNTFTAYTCNDWNLFAPNNINNKHPDCNGDGVVNFNDTLAVYNNFGLTHQLLYPVLPEDEFNHSPYNMTPVLVHMTPSASNYAGNQNGYIDLNIGTALYPVGGIYGAYYKISYDTSMIQAGSVSLDPKNTWMLNASQTKMSAEHIDAANNSFVGSVVRYNHADTTGFGSTARIYFTTAPNGSGNQQAAFHITEIKLMDHLAYLLPLAVDSLGTFAVGSPLAVSNSDQQQDVILLQDFSNNNLILQSTAVLQGEISIYDASGRIVYQENSAGNNSETISTAGFSKGFYFLNYTPKNSLPKTFKIIIR